MSVLPEPQQVQRRSRGRRAAITLVVVFVTVAVLVCALWLADRLVRGIAEDGVADAIETKLPESVDAELDVRFGGWLFLPQLVSGTVNEVTISAEDASASGIPFGIVVVAHGVPLDESGTIDEASARVTGGEDAANALLALGGADPQLQLGDGTVSYGQETTIFGLNIGYTLVTEAKAHGDTVSLKPIDVELTSEIGQLDLTALVSRLLGEEPVTVCVASSLPEGVSVDDITVTPGEIALTLSAQDIPRNGPDLASRGSCDTE